MSNLVIAVGGTGKSVALVYLKLAKFFGKPFDLMIMDMPFGREESIDRQLNEEGIQPGDFITPWAGGSEAQGENTFAQVLGLTQGQIAQPVARALFAQEELDTLIENGMNCRPIVGATIAMRKFWSSPPDPQLGELRQKVGQYQNVFLVCSITGGTGSGVAPTLARWLTEVCEVGVHGVLFLPYIDIGSGSGSGPSNAAMRANAYATLSYLANPPGSKAFQDYVVIGLPEGLQPDASTISGNHPLHLLAATYILYFEQFLGENPQQHHGPFYLEIAANGLRESDVQPTKGLSFANAIYRQIWFRDVLNNLAAQKPDQAWDLVAPPITSRFLAWGALRESVRELAISSTGYSARRDVWLAMKKKFIDGARGAQRSLERFEAITARDDRHLVYDVDWDWMKRQAESSSSRARTAVKDIGPPNINRDVVSADAAAAAADSINKNIFEKLGQQASSISKGGSRQIQRSGNSTVFLPSGVRTPSGPTNIACLRLTNLKALIEKFEGDRDAVNMPDPQARRFQFGVSLERALENYSQNRASANWGTIDALAQFTTLLEGVIFNTLQIRAYDLLSFGFQSSPERRVLGVLVDDRGHVYGGTDPDTLFFPAPEAWNGRDPVLRTLANTNTGARNTNAGLMARALLKRFYEKFPSQDRPLWLRALDEYLQLYQPQGQATEANLRAGWKQVGPVELRMNDGSCSPRYLPVYEADFLRKGSYALGNSFVSRDEEIYLEEQNRQPSRQLAKIDYPKSVHNLTERMLGAGQIGVLAANDGGPQTPPVINYDELKRYCQALVVELHPDVVGVDQNPFLYPDVIRLPFEQDGFLAEYFLNDGRPNQEFGQRFIDETRSKGHKKSPLDGSRQPGDILTQDGQVIYVETYDGRPIQEMSLLGAALWLIFTGEATEVISRNIFNDKHGNVILEFNGKRFLPGPSVSLQPPDPQLHAADLRGLVHFTNRNETDSLFRLAVHSWLNHLHLRPVAGSCQKDTQYISSRIWWKPGP